ncbi:MAG: lytic murein transglycosylase [Candidatus Adiutrix sp.]|jgi:membrane-bound lytic murein transglycosylase B|nr:lytic murein transglycosylase [Candidatus Adiutrix sp.]
MNTNSSKYLPLLALTLASVLLASGCLGVTTTTQGGGGPSQPTVACGIPDVWRGPAAKLAQRGFSQAQLAAVFNSPNMRYTSQPMAAKLKELYGIYYRSDLTRELQEKLYQLGYDILIDGRGGSGTQNTIKRFQADRGLPQTGDISDATLAAVNKALRTDRKRALSSYSPPPAKAPNRTATYESFTNAQGLAKIRAFYLADKKTFDRMSRQFQVPGEVAASIMWIETRYGDFFGTHKAAANLASMAAASSDFNVVREAVREINPDRESEAFLKDYARQRGDWALNELAALMRYAFDNGHDPTNINGSIYGAIGWGQFMPSNLSKFGVDGDGDGRVDLFNKTDAIFSIGQFLKSHGWKPGTMTEAERRAVIMKYNKSGIYVNTVLYVADALKKSK